MSTWPSSEPEVALVVVSSSSLAVSDFTSFPPSEGRKDGSSGKTAGWEKSQTRQPKSPPTLHDSSARWPVTVVCQFDLAGGQSIIRQLILTVKSVWEGKQHRMVRFSDWKLKKSTKWNKKYHATTKAPNYFNHIVWIVWLTNVDIVLAQCYQCQE